MVKKRGFFGRKACLISTQGFVFKGGSIEKLQPDR